MLDSAHFPIADIWDKLFKTIWNQKPDWMVCKPSFLDNFKNSASYFFDVFNGLINLKNEAAIRQFVLYFCGVHNLKPHFDKVAANFSPATQRFVKATLFIANLQDMGLQDIPESEMPAAKQLLGDLPYDALQTILQIKIKGNGLKANLKQQLQNASLHKFMSVADAPSAPVPSYVMQPTIAELPSLSVKESKRFEPSTASASVMTVEETEEPGATSELSSAKAVFTTSKLLRAMPASVAEVKAIAAVVEEQVVVKPVSELDAVKEMLQQQVVFELEAIIKRGNALGLFDKHGALKNAMQQFVTERQAAPDAMKMTLMRKGV